jgi:ATP diphosphatase
MTDAQGTKKLKDVLKRLRDPKTGCPWDLAQSHESLLPYFFEELHEFQECVLTEKPESPHFQEELGDLIFQAFFHLQLLEEKTGVGLDELADRMAEKLIHRHPHIFDPEAAKLTKPEEVEAQWEKRKSLEKGKSAKLSEKLDAIPKTLASLQRAQRLGEKAASLGFDWKSEEGIWEKIEEELRELREAPNEEARQEEFGDLLFVLAQWSRKKNWSSETILHKANAKFSRRITAMESILAERDQKWESLGIDELEAVWQEVKKRGG